MKTRILLLLFIAFPMTAANIALGQNSTLASKPKVKLTLKNGFTDLGTTTSEWRAAIRDRHDKSALAALQISVKKLSEEERLWAKLIEERMTLSWPEKIEALQIPFKGIAPPKTVKIIIGNQGGEDAFVDGKKTMCFDLSRLHEIYGSAAKAENSDRIDRFFAHEFTHLLHKAWRDEHGIEVKTPFEYALWECLVEGLGNYRSLSDKWVSRDGKLTAHAESVLHDLQPIFVKRLSALEHAVEEESKPLLQGLSSGPFAKKWGALTVALWLAKEIKGDDYRLREWVDAGPKGILTLAQKHLPTDLKAKMPRIN